MSCCMREPMETAQSHGDDTRAVVARPKWAREHGLHTECGPLCRSMDGLIDVCSNEDEGRSERKTPSPCVETNRQKSEAKTKTEQHTTRHAAWTGQDRTGQDRTGQDRTGQDTSTGHFECAHHLSSVFLRVFRRRTNLLAGVCQETAFVESSRRAT